MNEGVAERTVLRSARLRITSSRTERSEGSEEARSSSRSVRCERQQALFLRRNLKRDIRCPRSQYPLQHFFGELSASTFVAQNDANRIILNPFRVIIQMCLMILQKRYVIRDCSRHRRNVFP